MKLKAKQRKIAVMGYGPYRSVGKSSLAIQFAQLLRPDHREHLQQDHEDPGQNAEALVISIYERSPFQHIQ